MFGVVVVKASMLNCLGGGVNLPWVYMHCAMYETWCNGFPEIYVQLEEGRGHSAMGICALCYI